MKKIVFIVTLVTVFALTLTGCQIGNRQIGLDTAQTFNWAIIQLGNGELLEGAVDKWRDFNESDVVQVTIDGNTYLTHYSNVILSTKRP